MATSKLSKVIQHVRRVVLLSDGAGLKVIVLRLPDNAFFTTITKVDGDKVTFQKYKKFSEKASLITLPVAKDAIIANATLPHKTDLGHDSKAKKIEGGLKDDVFTNINEFGVRVRITLSDVNKTVTQILIFEK